MRKIKPINVFQITDTHLFKDAEKKMFGVNTYENFCKTLEKIQEFRETQKCEPDFFILTGDLSQDETEESYYKITQAMESFGKKVYWIPGNHDNIETMQKVFEKSPLFSSQKKLSTDAWDFIFLNTKKDGTDNGYITETELKYLETEISNIDQHKSIAIIMHHHPMKVNTPLIDHYILMNPDNFWSVVEGNRQVKLVICGHVHGDYSLNRSHIRLESSPATCLQWEKGATNLKIINSIGFKIYQFFENDFTQTAKLWVSE